MTLKDLFQTVFNLKKKEAELKGKTPPEPEASKPAAASTDQSTAAQGASTAESPAAVPQEQTAASKSEEPALVSLVRNNRILYTRIFTRFRMYSLRMRVISCLNCNQGTSGVCFYSVCCRLIVLK